MDWIPPGTREIVTEVGPLWLLMAAVITLKAVIAYSLDHGDPVVRRDPDRDAAPRL